MQGWWASIFNQVWYDQKWSWLAILLLPFSWLFQLLTRLRFLLYHHQYLSVYKPKVPVIVVGNINVGGCGKTPLVIAIAQYLLAQGWRVGIVSRGYPFDQASPYLVTAQSHVSQVGDEPLMMAKRLQCPVVVSKNRAKAVEYLCAPEQKEGVECIISDDGLQHYALGRALEIAVIDAKRGVGNGYCLPAGPLREGLRRLKRVEWLVYNYRWDPLESTCRHASLSIL